MRFIICLLMCVSYIYAQYDCIKDYIEPLTFVQNNYLKQQKDFNKSNKSQQYYFEFTSIDLFPFFCLPGNVKHPQSTKVYLCTGSGSFYKYKDKLGDEHLQIGVVSYVKGKLVFSKTYRLFLYTKKPTTGWFEEKEPYKVIFNRVGESFLPQDTKK